MKQQNKIRESDRQLDLTLRRKYRLFQDTIRSNASTSSYYPDYSLPNVTIKHSFIEDSESEEPSIENNQKNPRKYRRTLSDCSKYKKTGVHVKGKRKAPPPPTLNSNNLIVRSTSETPTSTFGRNKKKRAPPPPALILRSQPDLHPGYTSQSETIESIFTEGFLEDKEIKAILEMPKALTAEQKRIVIENVVKVHHETLDENDNDTCLSNDTLKLEKGMLKSTKPVTPIPSPSLPTSPIRKDENPSTPLSPISPRPWYKRPLSGSRDQSSIPFKKEIILRTVDKRRNKKSENDNLPEISYSRNSLLESASKLGFFRGKSSEDSNKKKNDDKEKRKSGIGIPSISELDREAAEIVQKEQASEKARQNEANEKYYIATPPELEVGSPKTKDLITKFEESSCSQKITINTSFIGRKDIFVGSPPKNNTDEIIDNNANSPIEYKTLSESLTKLEENDKPKSEILGQWTCPYCTLENPNWRIICEVCEKIKPYDLRFAEPSIKPISRASIGNPLSPIKSPTKPTTNHEWNAKAEKLRKYFNSTNKSQNGNSLSKSASETSINKGNFILKPDNPKFGSPKLPMRNYLTRDKPDIIKLQTSLDDSKFDRLETLEESKEEIKHQAPVNINTNMSPQTNRKELVTQDDLEKEKERIREMIRKMNERALAEKYPVIKSPTSEKPSQQKPQQQQQQPSKFQTSSASSTPAIVGAIRKMAPPPSADQNKLGAIKKLFARKEKTKEDSPPSSSSEIIVNHLEIREPGDLIKSNKIYENFPIYENIKEEEKVVAVTNITETIQEIQNGKEMQNEKDQLTSSDDDSKIVGDNELSALEHEKVEAMTEQLKSRKGVEDFKATLRSSPKKMNNTDTLAINKILRNLEGAIADGEYELAASLAKKLARMKVSLSVTKQKERPSMAIDDVDIV